MEDQILPPSRLSCDEDTRNALTTVGQCVTLFVEIRTYKPGWLEGQSTQFNTWVFNLSTSDNHYVLSQLRSNPQFLKTVTQHLNMLKTSFLQSTYGSQVWSSLAAYTSLKSMNHFPSRCSGRSRSARLAILSSRSLPPWKIRYVI